jgi:cytidylate kinase
VASYDALIVAIDGAAGSGKSTLARALARELGLPYLNTGLMYRALALASLERTVDPSDAFGLAELLTSLDFRLSSSGSPRELEVGGRVPGVELASAGVEAVVSEVAAHREVRSVMVGIQRRLGRAGGVIEGRDIGSVVFPNATAKIFLEATRRERAARRIEEREEAGSELDPGGVARALHARDVRDARTNPHVPAAGAVIIDTTELSVDEVLARAVAIVRVARRRGRPAPEAP